MLIIGELVDKEYNIEYAPTVRLEELLAPDPDQSETSMNPWLIPLLEVTPHTRSRVE